MTELNDGPQRGQKMEAMGGAALIGVFSGVGLKSSKKLGLQHSTLNQEDDKYEYYTSEDSQGRRVQKMRKKRRGGRDRGRRGGRETTRSRDKRKTG